MHVYSLPGCSEPIGCFSHLLGAVGFAVLSFYMIPKLIRATGIRIPLLVFALATVGLLSISGIYHSLPLEGESRPIMQRIDHAAIFVMIAGTFTPVQCLLFSGFFCWSVTGFIWLYAIAGVAMKSAMFSSVPAWLSLGSYLLMGWIGVLSALVLCRLYGFKFVYPLLAGAIAYTVGAMIDFFDRPVIIQGIVGPHEVFHLAVLLGLSYHWLFVIRAAKLRASVARRPVTIR